MLRPFAIGALALTAAFASSTPLVAQDRDTCTATCGGRPGGEAANPPSVVACFRKCMGATGNSDAQGKKRPTQSK
jgi:hypothetical protein